MSTSVNIFIASHSSLAEITEELGQMLHVEFQFEPSTDDYEGYFFFDDERLAISVYGELDYENDRDMKFEEYQFQLKIRGIKSLSQKENDKLGEEVAIATFSKLKNTGKYSLLMTHNMDEKLDQFDSTT